MNDRPYSVPPTGGVIVKHPIKELTLRDQFAMAALTGLLSDPERDAEPSEYAECAYEYADAMFAAREQKK